MNPYVTAQPRTRIKRQTERQTDGGGCESALDHIVRASVINGIPYTVTRTVCTAVLLQPHYKTHTTTHTHTRLYTHPHTHTHTHLRLLQCFTTEREVEIAVEIVTATPLAHVSAY